MSQCITSPTSGLGTMASGKPIRTRGLLGRNRHSPESHHFFLPTLFFLPNPPFPNCFLFLNMAFFLLIVLTSRPRIQSSRWTSHFSCLMPEDKKQKDKAALGDSEPWLSPEHINELMNVVVKVQCWWLFIGNSLCLYPCGGIWLASSQISKNFKYISNQSADCTKKKFNSVQYSLALSLLAIAFMPVLSNLMSEFSSSKSPNWK